MVSGVMKNISNEFFFIMNKEFGQARSEEKNYFRLGEKLHKTSDVGWHLAQD